MPSVSRASSKSRSKSKAPASPRTAPAAGNGTADPGTVAVERALDLLEALARGGPAPLASLAEAVNCSRTAASGLLRTLQARGFAIQDDAGAIWRLGARWGVLSRAASEHGALAATAMPFLAELGKLTGENVYLRVRDEMENETVAIYQSDPGLRVYSEVGKRGPLHAGSARMLLAHAPEAVQTQVLAQRLPRFTPATRTDSAWIAADLHRIRMRGYLITSDEVVPGAVSVTAPVRDASGQVVAVLSVGAPSMRMRPPRPRTLLPQVVDVAARLSRALGEPEAPAAKPSGNGKASKPSSAVLHRPPSNGHGAVASGPHSIFR